LAIVLVLAGFVALVVAAAIAAYPTGSNVDQITVPQWVTVARVDDLQPNQPVSVAAQRLWLVKLDSGQVLALSYKDPRGCTVPWRPDFTFEDVKGWFRDPCLGSTYDLNGHKAFGPSSRGLDQYEVRISSGDVQAHVGPGAVIENAPGEAAPYR
jgi:nitrite reductase/ring-hydroxylating ferredoxin subunit